MGNVYQLPTGGNRLVIADLFDAAGAFSGSTQLVALILANRTDLGSLAVTVRVEDLQRRMRAGSRGTPLRALQELTKDGVLERMHPRSYAFNWNGPRVQQLAAQVRSEDAAQGSTVHAKPNSLDRYRYVWVAAYLDSRQADRRYRVPGAAMVGPEPRDRGWSIIEEFGSAILAELPTTLEAIADLTCRKYFALDKPELVKAKHPLSFLPREIQDELQRPVWFALKRTNRPTNDARASSPSSAPSASSSTPSYGARELLAGLPTAPRFAAAGGAS